MRRYGRLVLTGALAVGLLGACARADEETQRKIDQIALKVESIEKKIGNAPAGGMPVAGQPGQPGQPQRPQRPPGPDPTATYSIDIKGDAWEGAEHAKVTIVEAFEFA